jgi:hypothetical protein
MWGVAILDLSFSFVEKNVKFDRSWCFILEALPKVCTPQCAKRAACLSRCTL